MFASEQQSAATLNIKNWLTLATTN